MASRYLTSPGSPLTSLSISEANGLLKSGALSPVELVSAILERIEETEPVLHAYAYVLPEAALGEARRAEAAIMKGRGAPLTGIPMSVKDVYMTRDMPTEAGSAVLRGWPARSDGHAIAALRRAGAIIVGKTTTFEFAYGLDSPTKNPWKQDCWAGGSSVGSAVSVAVGSSMASLGTDTAGSIRVPASINGVVGVKPTYARVATTGIIPLSPSMDHCGPIAKTVRDAGVLLSALLEADPSIETEPRGRRVRLGVPAEYTSDADLDTSVSASFNMALDTFRALGIECVGVSVPNLTIATTAGITIIAAEASSMHQQTVRQVPEGYGEALRMALRFGEGILATDYLRAVRFREPFKAAMAELFRDKRLDALAFPTLPFSTVPAESIGGHSDMQDRQASPLGRALPHTVPFNFTGQPAVSLPCGRDAEGLPIGLQLVGRPFRDVELLSIAARFEDATQWHLATSPNQFALARSADAGPE